jgi:hypothetical protein
LEFDISGISLELTGAWLLWMSLEGQHLPLMGWQSHGAAVNTFFLSKRKN